MTARDRTPDDRDRHLRLVRRLRYGVVSAGVVGSLGVAGAVAASAQAEPADEAQPGGALTRAQQPQAPVPDDEAEAPRLGQGFGGSHASSGGS